MDVLVNEGVQNIGVGDLVNFPQYKTWYVVHVAPVEVAEYYSYDPRTAYTLFRMDGQKPYRRQPFTPNELIDLIENLNGKIYKNNSYQISVTKK